MAVEQGARNRPAVANPVDAILRSSTLGLFLVLLHAVVPCSSSGPPLGIASGPRSCPGKELKAPHRCLRGSQGLSHVPSASSMLRLSGGGPKGKKGADPGSAKGGGGGAAGNKKAAAQKAAETKKEEEPEVTITADEMIAEFYEAEENQEELNTDRRDIWLWSEKAKGEYLDGTRQVQDALLVRKRAKEKLPTKGNAPEGFLIKWRNANRTLNPYAAAQHAEEGEGPAVKTKAKKKK